jgi:ABC-type branched-subunit amino acid transport system substrate-binding protein
MAVSIRCFNAFERREYKKSSILLMISPGATSPFITELPQDRDKDMLFRTCPSDTLQGVVLGKLAATMGPSKLEGILGTAPGVAVLF